MNKCKHCNGTGESIIFLNAKFGNLYGKCQWCIGTGIHTPLSEDMYI